MTKDDQKVVQAFVDRRSGSSKELSSDGVTLTSRLTGRRLAHWPSASVGSPRWFDEGNPVYRDIEMALRRTSPSAKREKKLVNGRLVKV